jgi:hypothetical protein
VIWKYSLVSLLLMFAALRGVPRHVADRAVAALVAIGVTRAAVLLGMMQCSRGSFWTTMRVMSDLPFALLFAVVAGLALPWTPSIARSAEPQESVARVRRRISTLDLESSL